MQQISKKVTIPLGPLTETCDRSEKHFLLKVSEAQGRISCVIRYHQRLSSKGRQESPPSPQKKTNGDAVEKPPYYTGGRNAESQLQTPSAALPRRKSASQAGSTVPGRPVGEASLSSTRCSPEWV